MRVEVSNRAITFIRSDEPVARTVASGGGMLFDLAEDGRVLALEVHEQGEHNLDRIIEKYPDIESFMDQVVVFVDEMNRDESRNLTRRQNRRLHEAVRRFAHHVPA